ncbi:MAG: hypothetical protein IPJ65_04530 [Archangiaceae bacterium]|nr:hypothetical protein [Archangiaceae bacterium]
MPKPPAHPTHHHVPASEVAGFIDRAALERVVGPLLGDPAGLDFTVRCLVGEGPVHHRGANWVLLELLGRAVAAAGARPQPAADALAVPLRLPPHLTHDAAEQSHPLTLALAPLDRLAARGSRAQEAMIDCLTDGPPQHAIANVAMVGLLGALLEALETR